MFAACGILYNHESPRRPDWFVTQKIARAAAEIAAGRREKLSLGSLDARRDWGYAGDFVRGIWMILQHDHPDDYVMAAGKTHSIREFLEVAFSHVGLRWEEYTESDPGLVRKIDVGQLIGNPSRARERLGWTTEVPFEELVRMMGDAQIRKMSP